jgi:periodic tryptophan protein 1
MLPGIEIWDLDLLDAVEPAAVLGDMMAGQPPPPSKSAKKKAKKKLEKEGAVEDAELDENTHTGAVMALAWNGATRATTAMHAQK